MNTRVLAPLATLIYLLPSGSLSAKLGETLPQLIKRFGSSYTQVGRERAGPLAYRFRSAHLAVDVMMARREEGLVSNAELYYSDKPLLPNGAAPPSIVRGVMDANVPGAKWHEIPPVGRQKAAFATADGTHTAVILPPNKLIDESSTFVIAIGQSKGASSTAAANQSSSNPVGRPNVQPSPPSPSERGQPATTDFSQAQKSGSFAVTLPTGKVVHFQTAEEKANYLAAINAVPVSTHPTSAASPPPELMVIGHSTRYGLDPLQLSDGNVALRAALEVRDYENNEIAADQRFKGSRQPIFGVIDSFGVDILGHPYFLVDRSEGGSLAVQCSFPKNAASLLASLQKGQLVAVIGKQNGMSYNVQISGCALIPWEKSDPNATEMPSPRLVGQSSY